jgi:uncharacterized protein YebE (UPF0316 family)
MKAHDLMKLDDRKLDDLIKPQMLEDIPESLEQGGKAARRLVALGKDGDRMLVTLRSPEPSLSNNHHHKSIPRYE